MKKLLSLTLLLATLLTFSACDDKNEPEDNLKGTEWTHALSTQVEHLEFVSKSKVDFYHTENGALVGKVGSGTYTINGNKITFSNLESNYYAEILILESAVVSGKTMEVYYNSSYFGKSSTTFRKAN